MSKLPSSQHSIRFMKEELFWYFSVVEDVIHVLFLNPPHSRNALYFLSVFCQSYIVFRELDNLWGLDRDWIPDHQSHHMASM